MTKFDCPPKVRSVRHSSGVLEYVVLLSAICGIGMNFVASFHQPVEAVQTDQPYQPFLTATFLDKPDMHHPIFVSQRFSP